MVDEAEYDGPGRSEITSIEEVTSVDEDEYDGPGRSENTSVDGAGDDDGCADDRFVDPSSAEDSESDVGARFVEGVIDDAAAVV